jgi:hypothetical protein
LADSTRSPLDIHLEDEGHIRSVSFENIVIEDVTGPERPPIKITNATEWEPPVRHGCANGICPSRNGTISDISFRNVVTLQCERSIVELQGSRQCPIERVSLQRVGMGGTWLAPGDERVQASYVEGLNVA